MRVLVVGCGSIGERHIRNMKNIKNLEIIVCDEREDKLKKMCENYNIQETYSNFRKALEKNIDATLICTPPSSHIQIARVAVAQKIHVFIEKPISNNLENVDKLEKEANKNKRIIMIGSNLRFHPCLQRIKKMLNENKIGGIICAKAQVGQYLPDWHPGLDYRTSYSAQKALGGGVLLDSATHEYDYITWFLGKPTEVFCFARKLSNLQIETEDIAETLMLFGKRAIAEVLTDYVQRTYSRSCQLIGEDGTILWNFRDNRVKLFTAKEKQWQIFQESDFDFNETYVQEIKHFVDCIEKSNQPIADVESAKTVMKIILAAKRSSETGKAIPI